MNITTSIRSLTQAGSGFIGFRAERSAFAAILILTFAVLQFAQAQTFNVVHTFTNEGDGGNPYVGLTIDGSGNLYGAAYHGGSFGHGEIFKLKRTGSSFVFQPLYSFTGATDGAGPSTRVVFGPDGALYGSAIAGGQSACSYDGWVGCGTIFKLQPPITICRTSVCSWTLKVVYSFQGGADGAAPQGDITFDAAGRVYGTTLNGGNGVGTVYELTHDNGGWAEQILYRARGGDDGGYPYDGVSLDMAGNLDGVFAAYGPYGGGTVYQLTAAGGRWSEQTIHAFNDSLEHEGDIPKGGLIIDRSGNLYGTTTNGGPMGGGTIFELMPIGQSWAYSVLYNLTGSDGGPQGKLVMDASGNFYGTTVADGSTGQGTVFELSPLGNGQWNYTLLHEFDGSDGANPYDGLALDGGGNLYGTAANGAGGFGVVFKISPQ